MEKIIRAKEIEQRHSQDKEKALNNVAKKDLEGYLDQIGAQMDLEMQLMEEELQKKLQVKESELRTNQEEKFFSEKRDMVSNATDQKKIKLRQAMGKAQDDKTLQEVGRKMLTRIDFTQEEEIEILEQERDQNIEKARMKIIAQNEDEIKVLQENLNAAVDAEEEKIDAQLNERREQILQMKRTNLEDRLRLFAGEMSEQQIKELRQQYQRELEKLEKAIRDEKNTQLNKMRSAMLSRRIEKESRRKQLEREKDELTRR